jgi:hypothetical protein
VTGRLQTSTSAAVRAGRASVFMLSDRDLLRLGRVSIYEKHTKGVGDRAGKACKLTFTSNCVRTVLMEQSNE